MLAVSLGEVDLGGLAFDQGDDRAGQLLFALEAADLAGHGIDVEQFVLLHEAGRAVLVLEDDEMIVAVEVELLLQIAAARVDVVGRIDFFQDDVFPPASLVFLEQVRRSARSGHRWFVVRSV